jgi:hypothetical protein
LDLRAWRPALDINRNRLSILLAPRSELRAKLRIYAALTSPGHSRTDDCIVHYSRALFAAFELRNFAGSRVRDWLARARISAANRGSARTPLVIDILSLSLSLSFFITYHREIARSELPRNLTTPETSRGVGLSVERDLLNFPAR